MSYINLNRNKDGKLACSNCESVTFRFKASFNLETEHQTAYECSKCKKICTVITLKEDLEMEDEND